MEMFKKCKNTDEQGNIGLGQAIAYFTKIGYTVCIPLNDTQPYDLVVNDSEGFLSVSVKTSRNKEPSGYYRVDLRTKGGSRKHAQIVTTFSESNVDTLFVLTESGIAFWIPKHIVGTRKTITLNDQFKDYIVKYGPIV